MISTITMKGKTERRKEKTLYIIELIQKKCRQSTTINCICRIDIERKNSENDHKMNHNKMDVDLISH